MTAKTDQPILCFISQLQQNPPIHTIAKEMENIIIKQ
jgi:hypothetical protein